jgi:hypothetical protein
MTDHVPPRARLLPLVSLALALATWPAGGLVPGLGSAPAGAQVAAGTPGVTHYFGRGAFEGIRAAVAATPRSCGLSDEELTALVMAPIFKEVSMAPTPETAPSPMTLSRWDEWTGVASGSNNVHANYGLYAFRDPATPYPRAYWTPGVGIFQYDSAGVGAPFTAAQLIDVQYVAGDVAAGMASRYCASGGSRAAAWQPWAALGGVAKSEALYQEMLTPGLPAFARIGLVDGIEDTGGMQARTCLVGGQSLPCWYVDPGRAQGANWWATDDPTGGARASGEAPLTAPLYVVARGDGSEERYWMSVDTGYPVNIAAKRVLGQNARPRDGQPASGLTWWQGADLCDTARPEMGCTPPPPPPPPPAPEPEPATQAAAATADVPAAFLALSKDAVAGAADPLQAGTAGTLPDVLSWMRTADQFGDAAPS